MPTRTYLAVFEREKGEADWSITFPQFPGVTSVAEGPETFVSQARDALGTAIEDRLEHGEPLPPSLEDGALPPAAETSSPTAEIWSHALVEVQVAGPSVRVNVSLEGSLLSKIDEAARRRGQTRSALLAEGARLVLAQA